jgi:hypothetical protein
MRSTVLLIGGILKAILCRLMRSGSESEGEGVAAREVKVSMPQAAPARCWGARSSLCRLPARVVTQTFKACSLDHVPLLTTPPPASMPRVLARTPEWLVPPSPGFDLFAAKASKAPDPNTNQKEQHDNGPLRTIAYGRGTEVFVAQGNEVRWADLKALKDGFEETEDIDEQSKRSSTAWRYKDSFDSAYRVRGIY